jgi:phage-related protein
LWYTLGVTKDASESKEPILSVAFYRTAAGNELVRQWLKELKWEDRKVIGRDIKTAQYGWPLGMPLIRKLEPDLWEVRSHISQGIARIIFTVADGVMVLLHAFVKKTQKTPLGDLSTARQRLAELRKE